MEASQGEALTVEVLAKRLVYETKLKLIVDVPTEKVDLTHLQNRDSK